MGVSLQKVAGLSVVLKVALSNKNSGKMGQNSGKMGQNSGKQSISINGSALCGLILQQVTLQRDAPMSCAKFSWTTLYMLFPVRPSFV